MTKSETSPPSRLALSNGRRSVFLAIEMKEGYQVDKYSASFDEFLEDYRTNAAEGLTIETTYDQSGYTEARLAGVAQNIVAGIAIVVAVLFITLGWRAAVIVALSLPLCTLLSMLALNYLDVQIHQLSMTGLVVALGLLVDGSIVVTDEIRKHLLDGDQALEAMEKAVKRMTVPLVSATATTVLAFTPMAILQGPSGDFLGSLATCVIVMLIMSLLLALTVTPPWRTIVTGGDEREGYLVEIRYCLNKSTRGLRLLDRLVAKVSPSIRSTRSIHPTAGLCQRVHTHGAVLPRHRS